TFSHLVTTKSGLDCENQYNKFHSKLIDYHPQQTGWKKEFHTFRFGYFSRGGQSLRHNWTDANCYYKDYRDLSHPHLHPLYRYIVAHNLHARLVLHMD